MVHVEGVENGFVGRAVRMYVWEMAAGCIGFS